MSWTIYKSSKCYWATKGNRIWFAKNIRPSKSKWERQDGVIFRIEEYDSIYGAVERRLTPAETRKLFKTHGSPDGKPIKPAKAKITDTQMLTWIIGLINRGVLFEYVRKRANRRELRQAMRRAKGKVR